MAIMFATVPIIALYIYAEEIEGIEDADISGADGDVYVRQYLRADGTVVEAWAEACIECGECEPKCPQNIPIREQLKETAAALGEH